MDMGISHFWDHMCSDDIEVCANSHVVVWRSQRTCMVQCHRPVYIVIHVYIYICIFYIDICAHIYINIDVQYRVQGHGNTGLSIPRLCTHTRYIASSLRMHRICNMCILVFASSLCMNRACCLALSLCMYWYL